jgi:hypothetical protein
MQRSKGGQALDDGFDVGIDNDSLIKFSATMNDTVSHDVDFRSVLQMGRLIVLKTFQ